MISVPEDLILKMMNLLKSSVLKKRSLVTACINWVAEDPKPTTIVPSVKFNGGTSWPIEAGHPCIGCWEPDFWDGGGFYKALSLPTENITQTAVYTAAGAVAAGVALGALNRAKKNSSNKAHIKITIDDLEK